MTTQTSPAAPAVKPPLRLFLTVVHLAALGVIGSAVLSVLGSLLGAGLGTILILGIGAVILVGLVYALFGVAWFEVARVDSLYGFGLAPLRWRRQERPGFGGYLRMLGRQSIDGGMWRALANFTLATIAGVIVLRLVATFVASVFYAFSPLADAAASGPFGLNIPAGWVPVVGVLGAAASAAVIFGLVTLHWALSQAIVAEPHRRTELTQRAEVATQQRAGAVRAADVERTRIERDLHDGVQPRLVSVGMTLGLAQQKIDDDPDTAKDLIAEAHTSTKAAITELRQLARGIHASVLDDRGLDAALSALAGRSHIPCIWTCAWTRDRRVRAVMPRPPCTSRSPSR
nr:histidine kinase dimerization/phosphoacceptor domain-containing protein [Microbacterium sp. NIBRBAC000506063]